MEVGGLCIKFLVHVLVLLCAHVQDVDSLILHLEPNRQQFFEYESLTFHCEGAHYSTGLKIVHRTKGELLKCKTTETSTRSSCTVSNVFPEDSGYYWCESGHRKTSNIISITVSAGHVILESPISVVEGDAVTLNCRYKTNSSILPADFYKDGRLIRRSPTGNMTIPAVSTSDEGSYKCSISGRGESAVSLMAVEAGHVILESPISVVEGDAVTLNCRVKTSSSILPADFYKDGRLIRRSPTGNMRIPAVSKLDEGFYKCNISGRGESAESLMAVEVLCGVNPENQDEGSIPWIVTVTVLLVLLLLVGLLHLVKCYWNRVSVEAGREVADAGQPMYAMVKKDRTKKVQAESSTGPFYSTLGDTQQLEPGASTIPTLTVRSARTDRPLTQESFYSTIH